MILVPVPPIRAWPEQHSPARRHLTLSRRRAPPQGRALPAFARVSGPERMAPAAAGPGPRQQWRTHRVPTRAVSIRIIPIEQATARDACRCGGDRHEPMQAHGVG
jgi:hypothetical protein